LLSFNSTQIIKSPILLEMAESNIEVQKIIDKIQSLPQVFRVKPVNAPDEI